MDCPLIRAQGFRKVEMRVNIQKYISPIAERPGNKKHILKFTPRSKLGRWSQTRRKDSKMSHIKIEILILQLEQKYRDKGYSFRGMQGGRAMCQLKLINGPGRSLQPEKVPLTRIEPRSLWSIVWCSIHLAKPAWVGMLPFIEWT